uniref:Putative secreted protein n=1 Tax=Anopheles darlingi TaxID=43151 RepID=A0A2M4DLZ9_ANODA
MRTYWSPGSASAFFFTVNIPLAVARPYLFSREHSYRPSSSCVILDTNKLPAADIRYLSFGVIVRPSFCHLICSMSSFSALHGISMVVPSIASRSYGSNRN